MPENEIREYNPIITGFSGDQGPLDISLNEAKRIYGQLPSEYGFVSARKTRAENRSLNLKTGHFVRDLLSDKQRNLKREVHRFFAGWHRDMGSEFQIRIAPFFNINGTAPLGRIVKENEAQLSHYAGLDIQALLLDSGLIRKDVLLSIHPDLLLDKTVEILTKKIKQGNPEKVRSIRSVLNTLDCFALVRDLGRYADGSDALPAGDAVDCFADEISELLVAFNRFQPLTGIDSLTGLTGSGVEFAYATRDYTYLTLGKITGDCTADKRNFQSDSNIENIFWTVFSWILDRNYQILKVFFNGEFVMKVHLLPLYVTGSSGYGNAALSSSVKSDYVFLAVDAIETTLAFRDTGGSRAKPHIFEQRDTIFNQTVDFIENLARQMNIDHIYAEKFSNTPWIRDIYKSYPEILFHVNHLMKIDQLEDVFELAGELCGQKGYDRPETVFMELQMKNTYLSPGYINKAPGVKSFAMIRGNPGDGIPMKRVIGV